MLKWKRPRPRLNQNDPLFQTTLRRLWSRWDSMRSMMGSGESASVRWIWPCSTNEPENSDGLEEARGLPPKANRISYEMSPIRPV